ncbi:MAG TPA: TIGR04282 family arsenosugar biosynthesis glycosyltransferase [Terriglobia bacterium]|nr:TIGR04282 family arsenosugar biosynthesis glycosyltransferase [Terriglobia bacterium]
MICAVTFENTTLNATRHHRALVIFARSPVAGESKTRLIPLLGAIGAARFQRALALDALSKAGVLQTWLVPYVAFTGRGFCSHRDLAQQIPFFTLLHQRGADLGERLARTFRLLLPRHRYVVAIGTDSPELAVSVVRKAFRRLRSQQAVLGPCPDGGFYLLGLRRGQASEQVERLFRRIRWGTRWALGDSLRNITSLGLDCPLLETIADIDRPVDIDHLFGRMSKKRSSRRRAPYTWEFLTAELEIYKQVRSGRGRRTLS